MCVLINTQNILHGQEHCMHFIVYLAKSLITSFELQNSTVIKLTCQTSTVKLREVLKVGYRCLSNCVYRTYSSIDDLLHDSRETLHLDFHYHTPGLLNKADTGNSSHHISLTSSFILSYGRF